MTQIIRYNLHIYLYIKAIKYPLNMHSTFQTADFGGQHVPLNVLACVWFSPNNLLIEVNHRKDLIQLIVIDYLTCAKCNAKYFHILAEFTSAKILLKRYNSYFTGKETDLKMSKPKVNTSIHWDSSLSPQNTRYSVDHCFHITA